jgi:primary-amine oxidase
MKKNLSSGLLKASLTILVCLLAAGRSFADTNGAAAHPLDPLGKEEIIAAVDILKSAGKVTAASRYPIVVLREPPKSEVLSFKQGDAFRREAFIVIYERDKNSTSEAVVDLRSKKLLSWKDVPGAQPNLLIEDVMLMQTIVRGDPGFKEAISKRGITDMRQVQVDPWSAGYYAFPDEEGKRIFRAVPYHKGSAKNAYARPIEGLLAYVDMNAKRVLKLIDTGVVPVSRQSGDYDEQAVGKLREAPKPLVIAQPEGASFTIAGHEVRWQKWRFRYSMHPREGLVLHMVGYEEQGKVRPVIYRASLSEMVVPYGDPGETWFFRNAFDMGEYAMGRFANQLEPLTDAPENAVFLNNIFPNEAGGAFEAPRTVAIFERDGGLLWKHLDFESGRNESRRARQLIMSWIATVGNYEYGFNWIFHQDGTLVMEVDLTGIMQAKGVKPDESAHAEHFGHMVAEGVAAVHHQHFFNFRLDTDIDGTANSVVEMNTAALPAGPRNPYANAFTMTETLLSKEKDAQRLVNMQTGRKWKVINPGAKNSLGQPAGYMLVPGENSLPYALPESSVRKRAGFLNAHLWATRFEPGEMNAAGYYVSQSKGGDGLTRWTAANRPIENQDVVLWYTLGVTHIPRPEEWPIMTVHKASFKLIPAGFFARNPAIDVPKPKANGQR